MIHASKKFYLVKENEGHQIATFDDIDDAIKKSKEIENSCVVLILENHIFCNKARMI
jgi:hypothetical protein